MSAPVEPWVAATARCEACGHEWVAVHPLVVAARLECSACHALAGVSDGPRWPPEAPDGAAHVAPSPFAGEGVGYEPEHDPEHAP